MTLGRSNHRSVREPDSGYLHFMFLQKRTRKKIVLKRKLFDVFQGARQQDLLKTRWRLSRRHRHYQGRRRLIGKNP